MRILNYVNFAAVIVALLLIIRSVQFKAIRITSIVWLIARAVNFIYGTLNVQWLLINTPFPVHYLNYISTAISWTRTAATIVFFVLCIIERKTGREKWLSGKPVLAMVILGATYLLFSNVYPLITRWSFSPAESSFYSIVVCILYLAFSVMLLICAITCYEEHTIPKPEVAEVTAENDDKVTL